MSYSSDTKDWQAEDDFRTLQRAQEVKSDGERHSKAIAHGKKMVAASRKVLARGQAMKDDDGSSALAQGFRKL
jgi:hypothetical protein